MRADRNGSARLDRGAMMPGETGARFAAMTMGSRQWRCTPGSLGLGRAPRREQQSGRCLNREALEQEETDDSR